MNPTMHSAESRIYLTAYGDASVLQLQSFELPPPAAGEVRVRHTAIGVNYVDIYHRSGLYPLPDLPATPGVEAAGVIEAIGAGVSGLAIGQRVAYAGLPGSYASARNLPAQRLIKLPGEVSDQSIAAALLRGVTAHMLFDHIRKVQPGDTVLIHAAAGGLGLLLVQWAKTLGARVIGTVSTPAKAALAISHGLNHAILYREQPFAAATLALTDGHGVDYAVDGIGGQTLQDTLSVVSAGGVVASVGQVAGPNDAAQLAVPPAVTLCHPSVIQFMADATQYQQGAAATLHQLTHGLRATVAAVLPLDHAAQAHRLLESGQSTGAILLQP